MWKIIDTGPASATENMAIDARLLEHLANEQQPILHLYDWNASSATFGYFTDPYTLVRKDASEAAGLQIARRPTGGGMIFHLTDFAFSVLVPAGHMYCSINTLDNYAFVNNIVIRVIRSLLKHQDANPVLLQVVSEPENALCCNFCMSHPTKYDVMFNGKKVGGAAQRRTRQGFLHQGSISLAMPNFDLLESLLISKDYVLDSMKKHTSVLFSEHTGVKEARDLTKQCLIEEWIAN